MVHKSYQNDRVVIWPSGDTTGAKDVANITAVMAAHRDVSFAIHDTDEVFYLNAPITVNPIADQYMGRTIDFGGCTFESVVNGEAYPTNAFIFTSDAYPNNFINTTIINGCFDGKVTESFIKLSGSYTWNVRVDNIYGLGEAPALIEWNSDHATYNAGVCQINNLVSNSLITNTILFSKETSCTGTFDDFVIKSIYNKAEGGSCIYMEAGTKLVYCQIDVLVSTKDESCGIKCANATDNYLIDCDISNMYIELQASDGDTGYGIYNGYLIRCSVAHVHINTSIADTGNIVEILGIHSRMDYVDVHDVIVEKANGFLDIYYVEELTGSKGNTYRYIGVADGTDRINAQAAGIQMAIAGDRIDFPNGQIFVGGTGANSDIAMLETSGWSGRLTFLDGDDTTLLCYIQKDTDNALRFRTYDTVGETAYITKISSGGKLLVPSGIGVGNSAAATTPGSVTKKIQVFDASGNSLGYIAVYNAIT